MAGPPSPLLQALYPELYGPNAMGTPSDAGMGAPGQPAATAGPQEPPPPAFVSPTILPPTQLDFRQRLAAGMANYQGHAPAPYESGGSRFAGGLLSGLAGGFSKGTLANAGRAEEARKATNVTNQAAADRANFIANEQWKAKLADYYKGKGEPVVTDAAIADHPKLAPFKGQEIGKLGPILSFMSTDAKASRTTQPSDAGFVDGLAGGGQISKTQANYFKKQGMTDAERSDLATKSPSGGGMGGNEPMTPGAISFVGDYLIRTGQLLPFGMGNASNRGKVFDYVSKNANASDVAGNKAGLASDQAALTQTQRALSGTTAFENTARANVKVLTPYIKALSDTGSPLLNMPVREFQAKVAGDPKMAGFRTALQTVSNEYSRLLTANPNMTGEMSDAARREGERLLSGDLTVNGLMEALSVLEQDANNRLASYQAQVDTIKGRIGRGGGTSGVGGPPAGRTAVIGPNGESGTVPAGTALPAGWRAK